MVFMAEENLTPSEPGQMDIKIKAEPTNQFLVVDYSFERAPNYVPPVVEERKEPTRLKVKTNQNQTKKDEN